MLRSHESKHLLAASIVLALVGAQPLHAQSWGQNGVTIFQAPTGFGVGYDDGTMQDFGWGSAMNNLGQVAGFSGNQAAVFTPGGGISTLGTFGGTYSYGIGINDSGQVTGEAYTAGDATYRAFLYDGSGMQDLGTLGGMYSWGNGINDSGQVTGESTTAGDAADHAFLYDGSGMQDLGTLGGTYSGGYGINDSGQVTGESTTAGDAADHAFLYDGSGMQDLGTLGGTYSGGYGINDSGQVTGEAYTAGNAAYRAFLYDGSGMQDLGTLGGMSSWGYGINNLGQVVGNAQDASNFYYHAALWENTGSGYEAFALDDLVNDGTMNSGWSFTDARSISDDGRYLLAYGSHNGAQPTWAVLEQNAAPGSVTPEPVTLLLLGTGLFGVGVVRRRRSGAAHPPLDAAH